MARKPRLFSTAPITAMQDRELTGLEWRVLLWVSLHDGMSLVKGSGAGCYASNLTLFAEVGCDYAAGCRALSNLVKRGHLQREQVGRSTRYRVVFGTPDMLPTGNLSAPQQVAGSQDEPLEYVAEPHEQAAENAREHCSDYSSLSEELDSGEPEELNSMKWPHLGDAAFSASSLGIDLSANKAGKTRAAEAGLVSEWRLAATLPRNFTALPLGAQVSRIDRAYTELGRDPHRLDSRERLALSEWMGAIFDEHAGGELDAVAQQANRLIEDLAIW